MCLQVKHLYSFQHVLETSQILQLITDFRFHVPKSMMLMGIYCRVHGSSTATYQTNSDIIFEVPVIDAHVGTLISISICITSFPPFEKQTNAHSWAICWSTKYFFISVLKLIGAMHLEYIMDPEFQISYHLLLIPTYQRKLTTIKINKHVLAKINK